MARVDSPAALLAVIPHLLGFMPEASVVVIGLTPPRDRVRVTLRYDLPDPPDADLVAGIAAHAVGVISSQRLPAAIAVGYGPEPLVAPVVDAAPRAGIDLHDVLRVEDGRYWSDRCGDQACCPATGVPFDATAHPVAADMAAAGKQVLAGRAAVAARVAPLGGIAAESMRQATRRAERHVAQLLAKVRKSGRPFGDLAGHPPAGQLIAGFPGVVPGVEMHPDEIRQRAQAIEFVQGGGQQRSRAGSPEPARGPGDAVAAGHAGALHALLAAVDGAAAGALAAAECLDDAPVDRQFLQDQADDAVIGLQRDLLEPGNTSSLRNSQEG